VKALHSGDAQGTQARQRLSSEASLASASTGAAGPRKSRDIIVCDGVDELGVIGPLEVLRRVAQAGADQTVRLVTRTQVDHVTGACGLRFSPDAVFTPGADVVVVPGGGWMARDDTGAWSELRRGDWLPRSRTPPSGAR
jgi:putative intracellular protease/amidase